jgi:hypothetical protein
MIAANIRLSYPDVHLHRTCGYLASTIPSGVTSPVNTEGRLATQESISRDVIVAPSPIPDDRRRIFRTGEPPGTRVVLAKIPVKALQ